MGRAGDLEVRVNKEERNNSTMPRLCGVNELKRLNTVLKNIRKGEKTSFACLDRAYVLDGLFLILTTKDAR